MVCGVVCMGCGVDYASGMYGVWCGLHVVTTRGGCGMWCVVWYVWGVVWTTRLVCMGCGVDYTWCDYTWRMWNVVCGVVCMGCGVDYTSGMYGVWCGLHVVTTRGGCGMWCVVWYVWGVVWTTRLVCMGCGVDYTWCDYTWCDHIVYQHGVVWSVTTWGGVVWSVDCGVPVPYRIFIPHI